MVLPNGLNSAFNLFENKRIYYAKWASTVYTEEFVLHYLHWIVLHYLHWIEFELVIILVCYNNG